MEGYFGEEDNRGKRQIFKLKGLSERSDYNGKSFSDLSDRDKRRLKNSTLRAINIRQLTPDANYDSVFHIFERLNTGGTALKAQEIRNAVYRGNIVAGLQELNDDIDWQGILGLKSPDRNQKDVELLLRLFGLFENWEAYEKPMLHFLNRTMADNRDFESEKVDRFCERFPDVTQLVNENLKKPFRPKRVVNTAMLEAVMVTLLEHPTIEVDQLVENYDRLIEDEVFQDLITGPTADTAILRRRIARAQTILRG